MNSHDSLLEEFETLTHDERNRRMVELGRLVAQGDISSAEIVQTLDALERGGFYERRLCLMSCFTSRDSARVVRFLVDPSYMLRSLAWRLVAVVCDDETLQSVLEAASPLDRDLLLRRLRRRGRHAAIDLYLNELKARGDSLFYRYLNFGSPTLVAAHLEEALFREDNQEWSRLLGLYSLQAADALQNRVLQRQAVDTRMASVANVLLFRFWTLGLDANRLLNLLGELGKLTPISQFKLKYVALGNPAAAIDLMMAGQEFENARFSHRRIAELDAPRLKWLLEHRPQDVELEKNDQWQRLPVELRAVVFECLNLSWHEGGRNKDTALILLPRYLREAVARRELASFSGNGDTEPNFSLASVLPWGEAYATIAPYLHDSDPIWRWRAWSSLVDAVRFNSEKLEEVLELFSRRGNEIDKIRGAVFERLATLSMVVWQADHLERLGLLIRHALGAADLSATTAAAIENLLLSLLPRHSAWAAEWLGALWRVRGTFTVSDMVKRFSASDLQFIGPFLQPILLEWETQERGMQITALARQLGKHLPAWSGLVEVLERIARHSPENKEAERALFLLARHCPERAALLIPELLESDPTWATRPYVYQFLHRKRQDLLTPFLRETTFTGRFSAGSAQWLLPVENGFAAWTPSQQRLFAQTLELAVQETELDSRTEVRVIRQLASLPDVSSSPLENLARVDNPRVTVRDRALRALATLDASGGLDTIVEALGDERSHIAIYTLRRSLLAMPPAKALELIKSVPLRKITVAKEVVRLTGMLDIEEAYQELLLLDKQELHPDIRLALLSALQNHLKRDETWPIIERAALSRERSLALAAGRLCESFVRGVSPVPSHPLHIPIIRTLLEHESESVRADMLLRCSRRFIIDQDGQLSDTLLKATESPSLNEKSWAVSAILGVYGGRRDDLVTAAVEYSLTNRPVLYHFVASVRTFFSYQRGRKSMSTVQAVMNGMVVDPLTATLQVELAISDLSPDEIGHLLQRLSDSKQLHADALNAALMVLKNRANRFSLDELECMELMLAESQDANLRRIALALLIAQTNKPGYWDAAKMARLENYRTDPDALVAAAAQFTFPPEEAVR